MSSSSSSILPPIQSSPSSVSPLNLSRQSVPSLSPVFSRGSPNLLPPIASSPLVPLPSTLVAPLPPITNTPSPIIASQRTPRLASSPSPVLVPLAFSSDGAVTLPMSSPRLSPGLSRQEVSTEQFKPVHNDLTVVKPGSPSTVSFSTRDGELENIDIEKSLIDRGYLPLDKVLTKDGMGNLMCNYIKSMDATGRGVFVELDCEGVVAVEPKDVVLSHQRNASVVPYSVKMGTYECASSDVCGVAFVCDNEICTLKRSDNSLTPVETVFTHHKTEGQGHHGLLSGHPIAYPIVRMSEILSNPEGVACSIKASHDRMRNTEFSTASKDTSVLSHSAHRLHSEVQRFQKNQHYVSSTLSNTISDLEKMDLGYKRSPPSSDVEKNNQRLIHYNLRKRHDLVLDHIKISEAVNNRIDRINQLTKEIEELNNYSSSLFGRIEGVMTE